ncbi:MAG: hypothetical protein HY302_16415 [Opitutae bacterium]|nr:hypothetical protein [Opitutae bacterium]
MQFSLPTRPSDLLPVPAPAPAVSGADAALLTPPGEGSGLSEFSAVLDGQTAAPAPAATLPSEAPAPAAAPRLERLERPADFLAAGAVPAPVLPAAAETVAAISPPVDPTAADSGVGRPPSPRPAVAGPRAPTRREEELAASLSLTAAVPSVAVAPTTVLTLDVSPAGEIAPAATHETPAPPAGPATRAAAVAATPPPQTPTMRAAQAFWAKTVSVPPTVAPVEENTGPRAESAALLPVAAPAPEPVPATAAGRSAAAALLLPTELGSLAAVAGAAVAPPLAAPERPGSPLLRPAETEAALAAAQAGAEPSGPTSTPAPRAARGPGRAETEKFSASFAQSERALAPVSGNTGLKKILTAAPQTDSEMPAGLGIGVAESGGKMRNDSQLPFAAFSPVEEISVASSAVAGLREVLATLTPAPELAPPAASRVQSVVNYIVAAAERLDAHTVSSMDLRFNFGATDRLSVRVELRDGAVHTTFRTDSAMLRETLGTAWRELAPANTMSEGRPVRLADPTIVRESAPAEFAAHSGPGDQRSSQQQPQHHRQSAELAETAFALAANRSRVVRRIAALVEPAVAPAALRPATARHLHAVA